MERVPVDEERRNILARVYMAHCSGTTADDASPERRHTRPENTPHYQVEPARPKEILGHLYCWITKCMFRR